MSHYLPESRVVPAQLSYLSIYSPALGTTDETFGDQIIFHWSRQARESKASGRNGAQGDVQAQDVAREAQNAKLRQVGLAQGMVDFARTFAKGCPVDSIETEKTRAIIKELEPGWWISASIDLTKLQKAKQSLAKETNDADEPLWEYSAREVSPAALLVEQLLSAHRTFLLHHGKSLDELLLRIGKQKLMTTMERFWTRFCRYWTVLLNGNPAVTILGGLKLSAGGELGIGVGEEDWGSSEREVLEDLVHRTEGLTDLIVSRYGDVPPSQPPDAVSGEPQEPWLGTGRPAEAVDGVIFGGTGAVSRRSVRDVSNWMEQIYCFGDRAYGVKDNPSRRRRKTRATGGLADATPIIDKSTQDPNLETLPKIKHDLEENELRQDPRAGNRSDPPALPHDSRPELYPRVASHDHAPGSPSMFQDTDPAARPGIPPPIARAAEKALTKATADVQDHRDLHSAESRADAPSSSFGVSDKWMKYLTLGLSTLGKSGNDDKSQPRPSSVAKLPSRLSLASRTASHRSVLAPSMAKMQEIDPMPDGEEEDAARAEQVRLERSGYFLVGYRGSLDEVEPDSVGNDSDCGDRLVLRTVYVDKATIIQPSEDDNSEPDGSSVSTFRATTVEKRERARIIVYIRRPFIYAFLFEQRTDNLQMLGFYKQLHRHLDPLHKSLSESTSAVQVTRRLEDAQALSTVPEGSSSGAAPNTDRSRMPVYDLLFDPIRLTVHSSIPNIPLPGTMAAEGFLSDHEGQASWTRIEALNVHASVLNSIESGRKSANDIERSTKTTRGWWVVWMRLPPSNFTRQDSLSADDSMASSRPGHAYEYATEDCGIAVLVRKASDWTAPVISTNSNRTGSGMFGLGRSSDGIGGSASTGWAPGALTGGVGFDARKYVEGLLSLNR